MTKFSPEPPRKKVRLHLSFNDFTTLNEPLDLSPFEHNGQINGTEEFVPGKVGRALHFNGVDTYVSVADTDQLDLDSFTLAFWVRPDPFRQGNQRLVSKRVAADASNFDLRLATDGEVTLYISDAGDTNSISLGTGADVLNDNAWTHVIVTFSDTSKRAKIYFDRQLVAEAQNTSLGDITNTSDVFIGRNYSTSSEFFHGDMDDIRLLTGVSDEAERSDIWRIGATHVMSDSVAAAWDNAGIPYLKGEGNDRLASTLAEHQGANLRHLDAVRDSTHIDHAAGVELDRLGSGHGILRQTAENDVHYRARIKATLAAGRSRGTFDDLLQATVVVTGADADDIAVRDNTSNDPGTALIDLHTDDLAAAELTAAEIEDILRDAVPGGHDITVREVGDEPFTVRDDQDTNDVTLGLTSDSINTGGTLVADV